LTLGGNSSFTGPLTMTGYGRLEMLQPTSLGTGTAALTLDGQLAYLGAPTSPTTVTIDRNVVFAGAGYLNGVEVPSANVNLNFTGTLSTVTQANAFRKTGLGTLTFSNAGTNTLSSGDFQVEEGAVVFKNGTFNKAQMNIGFQNGWGDFYVGDTVGKSASMTLQNGAVLNNQGAFALGISGGVGSLDMYDSALLFQAATEMNIGYLGGAQGTLTMVGSAVDAGVYPTMQLRGTSMIGRDGGVGVANITNATYWSEWTGMYVGIGPAGNGTLTLETTEGSVNQALLVVNGPLHSGYEASLGEINVVGNSSVIVNGSIAVGHWVGITTPTAIGSFNVNGGSVAVNGNNYVLLGMGGTGTWNQNGGVATINGPTVFGEDGGLTGTLNLNGGVYSTSHLYLGWNGTGAPVGRINFDGGTLQVNTAGFQFGNNGPFLSLRSTTADFVIAIGAGGAIIDTNGANQSFSSIPFSHDSTGPAIDGGLRKIGEGLLHVLVKPTYTGNTTSENGLLYMAALDTPDADVLVTNDSSMAVYTLDPAAEPNLTANTVTVDSTATLYVEKTITANTVSVFDTASITAKSIVADTLVIGGPGAANAAAVPEPATFVLLAFAALGLAAMGWRKK
jgi:autotransporter-associated beta strand protein